MKLAHFSPLPPQPSGIADYCAALLPHLAALLAVDIFTDGATSAHDKWRPAQTFTAAQRLDYDFCLYHLGNNHAFHANVYETMLRFPSVTVLHEFNLHGFYLRSGRANYLREMGYAYGGAGLQAAYNAFAGRPIPKKMAQYPLFNRVVALNEAIIVHTTFAKEAILELFPTAKVARIPLAAPPAQAPTGEQPPFLANLEPGTLLLGSFGYLSSSKRLAEILHVLAQARATLPPFRYVLVGRPVQDYNLAQLIGELGLQDIVYETGFVTSDAFLHYMEAIDIALNLRSGPTGGEMSATLMQLLAHGKPTLVSDVGGFVDFPDETVVKIQQDEGEAAEITAVLSQLMHNHDRRCQIGAAGQAYVQQHCTFPQVAKHIYEFLQEINKI